MKFAYENPEIEFYLSSTPYERKFPKEIELLSEKQKEIKNLCNRFEITDNRLLSAFFWISYWMSSEESITKKQYKEGKVYHSLSTLSKAVRELNVEKIKLYKLFTAEPSLSLEQLLNKKIVRDRVYSTDAKIMKGKLDKLRHKILNDSFFDPENIEKNSRLNILTRGKKPTYLNQYRSTWLKLMFALLKENTTFSEEDIFVICGWLFYINGHVFRNRRKQAIDPTDINLYKEDISKPLRSLIRD